MGRQTSRKGGQKRSRNENWATATTEVGQNEAYERYYRGSTVVPEAEWESFMTAMKHPLPMTVRVNKVHPNNAAVASLLLREELPKFFDTKVVEFVPDKLALQAEVSRGTLKKNVEFTHLKKLISALNERGYLTRQEAVSMIPPLLLDVKPGHRVLDMCAAPGSKTSQLLEAVMDTSSSSSSSLPSGGCVVANDVNASRLDILSHQTNRSPGAHQHLIITNHDAQSFPTAASPEDKFDRVLCDVMCSGDGTLRKSVDLWARWNTLQGPDLHSIQLRVLLKGMSLCKKGGVVVYSTCSLNPVEDEAVISAAVTQAKGAFRIMNTSDKLPGLIRSKGQSYWKMMSKDLTTEMETMKEAEVHSAKVVGKGFCYKPSMFHDTPEVLSAQGIEHCIRVLPHQQDTGGFFIAALECLENYDLPSSKREKLRQANAEKHGLTATTAEEAATVPKEAQPAQESTTAETTITAVEEAAPDAGGGLKLATQGIKDGIAKSFGFDEETMNNFPFSNLLMKTEHCREQKIYLASPDVLSTLQGVVKDSAKVVQGGVKVFESTMKHSNEHLRFVNDGISALVPYLPPKFFLDCDAQTLLNLQEMGGKISEAVFFTQKLGLTPEAFANLPPRCLVLRVSLQRRSVSLCTQNGDAAMAASSSVVDLGMLLLPIERIPGGIIKARVDENMTVLLKYALGIPIAVAPSQQQEEEEGDEEEKGGPREE